MTGQIALIGCDGWRVHRATLDVRAAQDFTAPIPAGTWQKLSRVVKPTDEIYFHRAGRHLAFRIGDIEFVTAEAESAGHNVETVLSSQLVWTVKCYSSQLQGAVKYVRAINRDKCQLRVARYRDDKAMWGMGAIAEIRGESPEVGDAVSSVEISFDMVPGNRLFNLDAGILFDAVGKIKTALGGELITLRFGGDYDPILIEGNRDGLAIQAVTFPIVDKPVRTATYPSEEDKQKADARAADEEYTAWIRDTFGLEGTVAHGQRNGRIVRMNRIVTWNNLKPDELEDFYEYYLCGKDLKKWWI